MEQTEVKGFLAPHNNPAPTVDRFQCLLPCFYFLLGEHQPALLGQQVLLTQELMLLFQSNHKGHIL